ncbi:hypothetical protein ABPG72_013154 [Tetrahymena utriculariae]
MGNCFVSKAKGKTEKQSTVDGEHDAQNENNQNKDQQNKEAEEFKKAPKTDVSETPQKDLAGQANPNENKNKEEYPKEDPEEKKNVEKQRSSLKEFQGLQGNGIQLKVDDKDESSMNHMSNRQIDTYDLESRMDSEQYRLRKRFGNKKVKKVRAETVDDKIVISEKITKRQRQMTPADQQFIIKSLGKHFVFSLLNEVNRDKVIGKMFYCENSEEYIFKQGDAASTYFIIEKGECFIEINGEVKKKLNMGDAFGELALLYGAPRSASVKADGVCGLWGIDRSTFRKAVEEIVRTEFEENRNFIEKVKFFTTMTTAQKDAITNVLITQVFKKGECIVNEGDMASSYYIIKKGKVEIFQGNNEKPIRTMGPEDSFGEQALYENSKRGATVKALDDEVRCIALGRDTIQKVLGDKIQVVMYNNVMRWAFEKNNILARFTKIQIEKIINASSQIQYKKGDLIFKKEQPCKKLIFVLESCLVNKSNQKKVVDKGHAFGEQWLFEQNKNKVLDDDLIMKDNGLLGEINHDQLVECIGGPIETILKKNLQSHEVRYMKKYDASSNQKYAELKLEEMIYIKKLGFGQFGSVYLVKNKHDNQFYALKVIQKAQVIQQNLEKHLIQEKKVLEVAQFPFMMKFIKTFKDNQNVYFLLEYVKGMELFDVIREIGLLNTYDSQFYIASLLLNIEYLHTNSIIYRDIKPENIIIDYKGYMKLIDMGTAKFLKGSSGKTFTIIGTPHYMAPEILTGAGYTYSVDLWSIGICLYEFMCGGVPFAEDVEDPYEIYEEIIHKNLDFPSFLKDKLAKNMMNQLLNKQPQLRLGGSFAALKANQWFTTFDWDKLIDRELKAPYIPPKDKLISDQEIMKMENAAKSVIQEVKIEQGNVKYDKDKAKDPEWDREF